MSSSTQDIEEGVTFTPKFDANGLVTAVVTDVRTGDVLMVAHMNEEALRKTIASGEAWYYSRSRKALWKKGETSGNVQRVIELRVDCDQDALWLKVEQQGRWRLPHRPPLVLLSRGAAGQDRRGDARIPRRGQAFRSGKGLQVVATAGLDIRYLRLASNLCARARCGRSYILPSMPTAPAPGCAANAATTAFAFSTCAAVGVNTSLMTGT